MHHPHNEDEICRAGLLKKDRTEQSIEVRVELIRQKIDST